MEIEEREQFKQNPISSSGNGLINLEDSMPRSIHQLQPLPSTFTSLQPRPLLPLPVATPIDELREEEENTHVFEGREAVISGVIIKNGTKKSRKLEIILCLLTIVMIMAFTFSFGAIHSHKNISNEPSTIRPLPPSTSESPIDVFDYDGYVKMIATQISGKKALNDPSSIQYIMSSILSENLPGLVDAGIMNLNDTKRIAQRYVLLLIRASATRRFVESNFNQDLEEDPYDECDLPFIACNENAELTAIIYKNQATTEGGGTIPTEVGVLQHLVEISCSNDGLRGRLPSEIGNLKQLRILDLSDNVLTGALPTQIRKLQHLKLMNIRDNALGNSIPSGIGNLKKMEYLDLSHNKLSGFIPIDFTLMKNLKGLRLDNNSFTGNLDLFCEGASNIKKEDEIVIQSEINFFSYNFESGVSLDCY